MRAPQILLPSGLFLAALFLTGLFPAVQVPTATAGEALPPGPPWKTDWIAAKQEAISTGRPIFAYFTKKH